MKILIVNKFIYPRGGDCIYCLNLRRLLEENGHQVLFFSMHYPENPDYPESNYFAPEISFTRSSFKERIKAAGRIFGLGISKQFNKILHDFHPDVVHLNNIHSYLSPIVAGLASKRNIKVVWTLHDYKLVCPSYNCICHNRVCTDCIKDKKAVISNKCMKNSLSASMLGYLENRWWTRKKHIRWVDTFICPSKFMSGLLIQAAYPANKLAVLNNFISTELLLTCNNDRVDNREKAYCFAGRITSVKGIHYLLEAAKDLPYKLYIAGDGEEREQLQAQYASDNICFLGKLSPEQVLELFRRVRFTVLPSIYPDNNPLAILESIHCGTPVIASRTGGIPELIDKSNGILFSPGNKEELQAAIVAAFETSFFNYEEIRNAAFLRFNENSYYARLLNIYKAEHKTVR